MELEDIVNEEMLTTEDVNNMLEHTDKGRTTDFYACWGKIW